MVGTETIFDRVEEEDGNGEVNWRNLNSSARSDRLRNRSPTLAV
jgi:hypothetical protein